VTLLHALTHLSPDAAVFTLTAGLLLIYLELNRPGWIIPGATGLLLTLFAVASLLHDQLRIPAVLLLFSGTAVLVANLLRPTHSLAAIAATVALILGFDDLVRGPGTIDVHASTAAVCGLVLGAGTYLLTGIARRARTNKRVRAFLL
jgi:membrane-bound serine protease (ClpP class)